MSKKKEQKFEQLLLRLEEISTLLESDDIGLEDSVKLYEEGIELSRKCYSILANAELKVTELKKQLDSEFDKLEE
ncbi:exodeoxyribonuclease 7 small subunit [bacterium BMS3Abin04]|nr:exodeoxyribonuclease 7 small subunit [bacterium BMS3Abin04]